MTRNFIVVANGYCHNGSGLPYKCIFVGNVFALLDAMNVKGV